MTSQASAEHKMQENTDQNQSQVDESGLEKDSGDLPDIEVPFDPSKIDIQVRPMTIGSLSSRLENEELDLTPDFQRQANVWDVKRKSRLIESVLLRIPLPSFYFSEDEHGVYAVVDGLQRLCTVFHFMDHAALNKATGAKLTPLRLQELQYLSELNGVSYAELDRKFQRRISELEITANIIRASTPAAVKFNVFARLNQGGMPLNAQEIRNAIYPGLWRKKLQELAKSKAFQAATEGKIKTQRQQDLELVLRFIALWQLGAPFSRQSNQTLDDFLNDAVDNSLRHWDERKWSEASAAFVRALDAARLIFGDQAFRKSIGETYRTPINRGLMEAQLVCLSVLNDSVISGLVNQRNRVAEAFMKKLNSYGGALASALLYATGSAEASNTRIREVSKILSEVANA